MEKLKKIASLLPEYYFILLAVLGGYTPPFDFNIIFVAIIVVFIAQLIFKNKITGLLLTVLTALINLLFLGALVSEFREFTVFNSNAQLMIFVGLSIFIVNTIATATMFNKYAKIKNTRVITA